jgi:hypothetical protein
MLVFRLSYLLDKEKSNLTFINVLMEGKRGKKFKLTHGNDKRVLDAKQKSESRHASFNMILFYVNATINKNQYHFPRLPHYIIIPSVHETENFQHGDSAQ